MNVSRLGSIMPVFLFCVASIIGSLVYASENNYTMEDLKLLDKQESYQEILDHMNDIRPTKRTKEWTELVSRAVTKTLEKQLETGDAYTAFLWSEKMLDSIPTLKESKAFMDLHNKAIIDGSALCFRNSYDGVECTEKLSAIIQKDPENKELAFKAGKLVRLNMHSSAAAPFFIQALKGRSDPKRCADPDVLLAIKAGMGLSDKNAKSARELGFSLCFNALKAQLLEDFYGSNNYAVVNYCDSLSEKKMLTEFQKAYCLDQQ